MKTTVAMNRSEPRSQSESWGRSLSDLRSPVAGVDIALVWAMAENRVLGYRGKLPWHLPSELALFKEITIGKPVIMGRRTFESIGSRPLPGRLNIVLSKTLEAPTAKKGGGEIRLAKDLDAALVVASEEAGRTGVDEIMVLGGGEVYAQALPLATRLYRTVVHCQPQGNVCFPEFDEQEWVVVRSRERQKRKGEEHAYSHQVLERKP